MTSLENGTTVTNDLLSAVVSVSKISGNRILPYYEEEKEGELTKIKIPVVESNPSDRTDAAMRGFLKDWVKRNKENTGVHIQFEKLPRGTAYYNDDKEFIVIACIVMTLWPKREESDFDKIAREREYKRRHREQDS
jgi:hypothetical protein